MYRNRTMEPLKIGLTGGIASGKSQISRLFAEKKVTIIDADQIARDLFCPGAPILQDLKTKFGSKIFEADGRLDRKALGKIVFNSASDLAWLNQLTHPQVSLEIKRQLDLANSPYVILDIPLLVDKSGKIPPHLNAVIDRVLVIDISPELQIQRLCERDQISAPEAQAVISNQSTLAQKMVFADDIIDNSGSLEALQSQVSRLHKKYLKISKESL